MPVEPAEEPAHARAEAPVDAGTGIAPARPQLLKKDGTPRRPPISHTAHAQDKSNRARVAEWLALKAMKPAITVPEAAAKMGLTREGLTYHLVKAGKLGLLTFDDALDQLKYGCIPKVVENLQEFLNAKDKQVTIETAKHTIFKSYQASEGIQEQNNMVLAIKIEAADTEKPLQVTGEILGVARELEGEVVAGEL